MIPRVTVIATAWLAFASCSSANLDAITRGAADAGLADATADAGPADASDARDVAPGDSAVVLPCPSPALVPGDMTQTVSVDSVDRTYVLHVPSTYDGKKAVPLVVDFHANGGSGSMERKISPYPAVLDPEGALSAFPSGMPGPLGTAWNLGPCCVADIDDVAFARALVAQVEGLACVDSKRVYAVGHLTGGGMAHRLACDAADLFAAVAPAGFDLFQENVGSCKPSRSITVVAFRGLAAQLVPYAGGRSDFVPTMSVTFLGAQATFQKWAQLDHCGSGPSAVDSNGCSSYANCDDAADVVLCTKQGGGDEAGNPNVAWPILKRHRLP